MECIRNFTLIRARLSQSSICNARHRGTLGTSLSISVWSYLGAKTTACLVWHDLGINIPTLCHVQRERTQIQNTEDVVAEHAQKEGFAHELTEQADTIRWHSESCEASFEHEQITIHNGCPRKLWALVCRFKYDINEKVDGTKVGRLCESHGINVSGCANALNEGFYSRKSGEGCRAYKKRRITLPICCCREKPMD